MSYFLHHHPHAFADLLLRAHFPAYPLITLLKPSPTKVLMSIILLASAPLVVLTFLFMNAHTAEFSFASTTCFASPQVLPGLVTPTQSSSFSLEQSADLTIGSTPLLSTQTCVNMHKLPKENGAQKLELKGLFGLTKTIEISTTSIPKLAEEQSIPAKISLQDSIVFTLDQADTSFEYILTIGEKKRAECDSQDVTLSCPLSQLELKQGKKYTYTLRRYLDQEFVTLHSGSIQIIEPLTLFAATIEPEQTIVTHVSEITLRANKELAEVTSVTLQAGSESIDISAQLNGKDITLTTQDTLPRGTQLTLTVSSATASDSAFLNKPYVLTFYTSAGPRVSAVDIEKTRVPVDPRINVTYDIGLQAEQAIQNNATLTADGKEYSVLVTHSTSNTLTISPADTLPKCTNFTITLPAGLTSIHGISDDGGAWSYSFKTVCYTAFSIGTSVNGQGIIAYKFGSGAQTVLFVGGLHGTESSSIHTLNAWINELETNYDSIPADKTIVVIPNASPDSYAASSRRNARNVDLNRNFPSDDWTTDIYQPGNVLIEGGGGTEPLSEPESAALASYVSAARPSLVLTYHAVARTVIYNGSGNSGSLAAIYSQESGFSAYSSSYEDSIFEYPTTGEFETWLHDKLGIPALLVENATTSSNEIASQKSAMWAVIQ